MSALQKLFQLLHKIRNGFIALAGAKTVGARALVLNDQKVLLVKHTYSPGWYTIGGGVEKGESTLEAMTREIYEEAGIRATTTPELFHVYHNQRDGRDDYIAFYIIHKFTQETVSSPEILALEWFELDDLPEDVSPATRRRIAEYLKKQEVTDKW